MSEKLYVLTVVYKEELDEELNEELDEYTLESKQYVYPNYESCQLKLEELQESIDIIHMSIEDHKVLDSITKYELIKGRVIIENGRVDELEVTKSAVSELKSNLVEITEYINGSTNYKVYIYLLFYVNTGEEVDIKSHANKLTNDFLKHRSEPNYYLTIKSKLQIDIYKCYIES